MQINSINSDYRPQTFKGGISANLYTKLHREGTDIVTITKKAQEIFDTNKPAFTLTDVVFNAKEKTAEFLLSVSDSMKFVPFMENIKPQRIVAKGENITEAFQNINSKELEKANIALERSYNDQFEATKAQRQVVYDKRLQTVVDLQNKFNSADGYWQRFYRQH